VTLSGTAPPVGAPIAARLTRPSWRDPRLLIGLVLLLSSAAIGARVIASADHTHPVYAARAALPSGTVLSADDLEVVHLKLTGTAAGYLDARQPIPRGQVVIRTVGAGEIVPTGAIAPADRLVSRPVDIPFDGPVPTGLTVGGRVDVWASAKQRDAEGGGYAQPQRIAEQVEVFDVSRPESGLAADRAASVEVLLPAESLPSVLDAMANDARVVVLPVPGTARGTS
jgi:Flp pilus assembly protein CpaB